MAIYALQNLNIQNSKAFMIEDTFHAIKMGKSAKIYTMGFTWGYKIQKELDHENSGHVINDLNELVKILREY